MTEKYKIYLSDDTRSRLINDAELFEFTKKDESVNLNSFLKTLIVNYSTVTDMTAKICLPTLNMI